MKWCRIRLADRSAYALIEGDEVVEVEGSPLSDFRRTEHVHDSNDVQFLLPVVPRCMYAMGANFKAHVDWVAGHHDVKVSVPVEPQLGHRSPAALIGPEDSIVIPPDAPGPLEAEGELVAVIGRPGKGIRPQDVADHVLGYTLGNDLSERGWQKTDRTNWRWKNSDTFKPLGPVIATDMNPLDQTVVVRVNGEIMSSYETANMVFDVRTIVSRLSRYVSLGAGDLIWLGSGAASEPPLHPGDVVAVECTSIGILQNTVRAI
jgi:2-keto-4-pentenoate hydratase/2-oxohepta-3-ene-1,7-dioic acid hydratase in catechol pathway